MLTHYSGVESEDQSGEVNRLLIYWDLHHITFMVSRKRDRTSNLVDVRGHVVGLARLVEFTVNGKSSVRRTASSLSR